MVVKEHGSVNRMENWGFSEFSKRLFVSVYVLGSQRFHRLTG